MDFLQDPRAMLRTITDPVVKSIAVLRVKDGESAEKVAKYCRVPKWLVQRWVKEGVPPGIEVQRKQHYRATGEDNRKLLAVVSNNPTISIREAMALSNYPASEQTARRRIKESNGGYLGPTKKAKLPLEAGPSNWDDAINQELQKVIDLFDDETEDWGFCYLYVKVINFYCNIVIVNILKIICKICNLKKLDFQFSFKLQLIIIMTIINNSEKNKTE